MTQKPVMGWNYYYYFYKKMISKSGPEICMNCIEDLSITIDLAKDQ